MSNPQDSDAPLSEFDGEPLLGSGFESEPPDADSSAETPSTEEHDQ